MHFRTLGVRHRSSPRDWGFHCAHKTGHQTNSPQCSLIEEMECLFHSKIHPRESYLEKMFHSIINKNNFLNIFNIICIPDVPIIKPINIIDYEFKQSKYEHVPKLPFRSIIVASSTGGKTVLFQNLIINVYKNCFSRIFIFSPSVHNDPTFVEVKKYQREEMKVDDTKEKSIF